MRRKLKILIAEPSAVLGGLGRVIRAVVASLPKDKFEVHVAAPPWGPFLETLEGDGAIAHPVPMDYRFWSLPLFAVRFRKLLQRGKFDVVHLHVARAGLLGCLGSLGDSAAIVYTPHGWRHPQKGNPLARMLFFYLERFICQRVRKVTCISHHDWKVASESGLAPLDKLAIIVNRLDAFRFAAPSSDSRVAFRKALEIPDGAIVVGTIGALVEQKDPETFLRACVHLRSQVEGIYFLWVGEGELGHRTLELAHRLGIHDRLRLPGHSAPEDIPEWLGVLDVFLLTSHCEGLPFSVLEAMAARRPVVASNVDGIPDLIQHEVTGWLFPPGNAEEAASCVREVICNRGKSKQVVENAYRKVSTCYSPVEDMAKAYRDLYEDLAREDLNSDAHTPSC